MLVPTLPVSAPRSWVRKSQLCLQQLPSAASTAALLRLSPATAAASLQAGPAQLPSAELGGCHHPCGQQAHNSRQLTLWRTTTARHLHTNTPATPPTWRAASWHKRDLEQTGPSCVRLLSTCSGLTGTLSSRPGVSSPAQRLILTSAWGQHLLPAAAGPAPGLLRHALAAMLLTQPG